MDVEGAWNLISVQLTKASEVIENTVFLSMFIIRQKMFDENFYYCRHTQDFSYVIYFGRK